MTPLEKILFEKITREDFITIADFMALALGHEKHGYYMKQDPFGGDGDFTTAPEISQLFGEMIAIWLIYEWQRLSLQIKDLILLEAGAGRGTLMADIMRIIQKIAPSLYAHADIYLLEISPVLKEKQREKLKPYHKSVTHISSLDELPTDKPILFLANEFFDALPVQQFIQKDQQWFERVIKYNNQSFYIDLIPIKESEIDVKQFSTHEFYEYPVANIEFIQKITALIRQQSGAGCIIDYGSFDPQHKDTLQAVYNHEYAPILDRVGDQDLTVHVHFDILAAAIEKAGLHITAQITQSGFLKALGIETRAQNLIEQNPQKKEQILSGLYRLTDHDKMGQLFKVLTFSSPQSVS